MPKNENKNRPYSPPSSKNQRATFWLFATMETANSKSFHPWACPVEIFHVHPVFNNLTPCCVMSTWACRSKKESERHSVHLYREAIVLNAESSVLGQNVKSIFNLDSDQMILSGSLKLIFSSSNCEAMFLRFTCFVNFDASQNKEPTCS